MNWAGTRFGKLIVHAMLIGLGLAAVPGIVAGQRTNLSGIAREPQEKIVGSATCGECHLLEYEVWKSTPHSTQFKKLHRTDAAKAVAKKLSVRLMKRDSSCLSCHYTPTEVNGQLRAFSGVSCESCHGAARDWIDIHNDYGEGFDRTSEPSDHRQQRIAQSREAGMRRPSDLLDTVASCFSCHTVPNETLVNQGGHTTGSIGFELVEWSQGQIRHNFLESSLSDSTQAGSTEADSSQIGEGSDNRERTLPEKRAMYVVGRVLDLEFSLRGLAEAKQQGVFAKAMSRKIKLTLVELRKILARISNPDLETIPAIVAGVRAVPNNRQALLVAADQITTAARRFLREQTADQLADQLADIDPLILGTAEPVSFTVPATAENRSSSSELDQTQGQVEGQVQGQAQGKGQTQGELNSSSASGNKKTTTSAATKTTTQDRGQTAIGQFKRNVRPPSSHKTLGPGACSGCHESANQWLVQDPHYRSADPFFEAKPANQKIARFYGLNRAQMGLGNQICMDCHGTVIAGNEAFDVIDGVSCESCHGAAKSFLEPHKEGDKTLGTNRPGYLQALQLGMVKLQDLEVRAARCSGCHYITEPRLISSGHPSGEDFQYAEAMTKIRHWQRSPETPANIERAFTKVLGARGAVPEVTLARAAAPAPGPRAAEQRPAVQSPGRASSERPARSASLARSATLARSSGATWNTPRPRANARGSRVTASVAGTMDLPPFPKVSSQTPIEDVMLLIKKRLEQLHLAIGEGTKKAP